MLKLCALTSRRPGVTHGHIGDEGRPVRVERRPQYERASRPAQQPGLDRGWTRDAGGVTAYVFPAGDRSGWHVALNGPEPDSKSFPTEDAALTWARRGGATRILHDHSGERNFVLLDN
jgi:hypothetical protein